MNKKLTEQLKLKFIMDNHFSEWLKTRAEVQDELSNSQSTFCICGKLATGLHENYCQKFSKEVNKRTIKKLEYLLPTDN